MESARTRIEYSSTLVFKEADDDVLVPGATWGKVAVHLLAGTDSHATDVIQYYSMSGSYSALQKK